MVQSSKSIINVNVRFLILSAILLAGIFLRVYGLSDESLWRDEAYSIKFANLNLNQIFFLQETNPPLYYIILHWWINLFGESEFSVRFPSVIFGTLSIWMMYRVGNIIFNKDVGIFSSFILGFSVFHIHYSQEARTYSLSVLLTLLSTYCFIKILRKANYTILFGYILFSTLLLYSHIYGLFIIISQNIYIFSIFLLSKKTYNINLIRWIVIQIILVFSFIPWVSIFINQSLNVRSGFWIPTPSLSSIMESFINYSGSNYLFLIFIFLSLFSIISYEKISGFFNWKNIFNAIESYCWKIRLEINEMTLFLLVWLLTPILLPFIISRLSTPIYWPRYTIVASLAFYILASRGITKLRSNYTIIFTICFILIFSLLAVRGYYTKINKPQWRDIANYVDTHANNEDLLIFNADYLVVAFDCYSKRSDLIKKLLPDIKSIYVNGKYKKVIVNAVDDYKRVWVILNPSRDIKGRIKEKLNEAYNLSYQNESVGIQIMLFERKG